jgi:DNA-binding response OmpR family regulator
VFDWGETALSLGANAVLVKPFDQERLLSVIQEVLCDIAGTKEAMPSLDWADKRKYTRLPVSLPVSFGDSMIIRTGTIVDISREGCRIHCPDAAPELHYFRVEIHLIEPDKLRVDLAVRRWLRHGDLGVEFIQMEPAQQRRLRNLIGTCQTVGSQS